MGIYMALLKDRLDKLFENASNSTQFGFRKSKATSQATHAVRRLHDYSQQSSFTALFAFIYAFHIKENYPHVLRNVLKGSVHGYF